MNKDRNVPPSIPSRSPTRFHHQRHRHHHHHRYPIGTINYYYGFLRSTDYSIPHILIVATFDLPPPPHHLLPNSSVVLDRTYVLGDEPTNERTDVPCPAHDFYVIPRFDLLRLFGLVVHVTQSSSSSAMNVLAGGRTTIYAHCHGGPGYMAWQWIKNRVGLPPHHHSRPNAGDPFVCSRN